MKVTVLSVDEFEDLDVVSAINKNIKLNSKVFSNYVNQKRIHAKDENLKLIYKVCFVALSKNSSLDNLNDFFKLSFTFSYNKLIK